MRMKILGLVAAMTLTVMPNGFGAIAIMDGDYVLGNHPDGAIRPPLYGLRLDGLFGDTSNEYTFTFENQLPGTEDDDAFVEMTLSGGTMTIMGRIYGGQDTGGSWLNASYWDLAFTFTNLTSTGCGGASGTFTDICRFSANPLNTGTLTQVGGGGASFSLREYPNNPLGQLTFQFGDENSTHRGFTGLSGWGWLEIDNLADTAGYHHTDSNDFLFTATKVTTPPDTDVPEPATMILLGTALVGLAARRKFRK